MANKKEKINRISINAMENVMKERFAPVVTEKWYDIDVTMRRNLPIGEMIAFVNDIVDMCFSEEGEYIPEVMDYIVRSGVLTRYANFTMPENVEREYALVYGTDAFDFVCSHINMEQLENIIRSATKKIGYMCDANVMEMHARLNELYDELGGMGSDLAELLGSVTPEDIQKVTKALSDGMNEEKLVSSYLKLTDGGKGKKK